MIAERILYLPSIGYCIAVTAIVGALLQASSKPTRQVAPCTRSCHSIDAEAVCRQLVIAAGLTILLLLAARTMLRNPDWSDERSLYQTGLHVRGGVVAKT